MKTNRWEFIKSEIFSRYDLIENGLPQNEVSL